MFFKRRNLKGSGISISDHLTEFHRDLLAESGKVFGSDSTWTSMGRVFVNIDGKRDEIKSGLDIKRLASSLNPPVHYEIEDTNNERSYQHSDNASSARGRKPFRHNNHDNSRRRERNTGRNQQVQQYNRPYGSRNFNPRSDLRYNR